MDTRVTQHTDQAPPYPESRKLIHSGAYQMLVLYMLNSQNLLQNISHAQALTFI